MKIILASVSPRRKEILEMVGLNFEIIEPKIEEKINNIDDILEVSYLKAKYALETIGNKEKDILVIGADTVVVFDDKILGKPKNNKEAFEMIKMLSDKTHCVYTGLSVLSDRKKVSKIVKTLVKVKKIPDENIKRYIKKENVLDAAGGYKIQGIFSCFIEKIEGDYYNVVGLPVNSLYEILKNEFGLDII